MCFLHNEWVPSVGQFWAWGKREADEKSTIFSGRTHTFGLSTGYAWLGNIDPYLIFNLFSGNK